MLAVIIITIIMTDKMDLPGQDTTQLLSLMQLASPSLPIGAFAYSQGLEQAIDIGFVSDRSSLESWCREMLVSGLAKLDAPILIRLKAACDRADQEAFCYWNQYLLAARETAELYQEDIQLGHAMKRLANGQGWCKAEITLPESPGFMAVYALAASCLQLEDRLLVTGFFWSWLENQLAVACKTIPLGQTDAQTLINTLKSLLAELVESAASLRDEELGGSLPGQALLSALHETQYSRLFRS